MDDFETESEKPSPCPKNCSACSPTFPGIVDKLGIRCIQEDVLKIISQRWCLVRLSNNSLSKIDDLVSACDFKFDYEAIEDIPERKGKFEKIMKKWALEEKQMFKLKLHEDEEIVKVPWVSVKLHEFSFCVHTIVTEHPKKEVSEGKYQTLFEKLLQLFGFNTLSQPFAETKKISIMGRTISSKTDIICSRLDTGSDNPVIFVCKWQKEDDMCPPKKRMKQDVAANTSMGKETDIAFPQSNIASARTNIGDHSLWAQNIEDLLVHLDKSFRYDGILGITFDKTWIRFTYLEVSKTYMKEMKERPANRPGPLNVDEDERPIFYYSERYNYLSRSDRLIIFKALMLIKKMQLDYEKIQ